MKCQWFIERLSMFATGENERLRDVEGRREPGINAI